LYYKSGRLPIFEFMPWAGHADLEIGDTADLEVCATVSGKLAKMYSMFMPDQYFSEFIGSGSDWLSRAHAGPAHDGVEKNARHAARGTAEGR
jgi:hypothetical protein